MTVAIDLFGRAFAERCAGFDGDLRRYALRLARNAALADDLVQDTLLRAIEQRHRFVPGTWLGAWLMTILHNLYVSHVRQQARRAAASKIARLEFGAVTLAAPQPAVVELAQTLRAIERLPRTRRAVMRRLVQGQDAGSIAAELAIPLGTVRSRLSRARADLERLTSGTTG